MRALSWVVVAVATVGCGHGGSLIERYDDPSEAHETVVVRRQVERDSHRAMPTRSRVAAPRHTSQPARPIRTACGQWRSDWADFEAQVVREVNARRSRGAFCGARHFRPAPPLRMEAHLQCAARSHSADMARRGFFSHQNPDGESPFDRISRSGYPGGNQAENISAGRRSPAEVVDAWMDSPGHCVNIMNGTYREMGVGYVRSGDAYGHYWTQTFGRR